MDSLSEANTCFGFDLFQQKKAKVFLSPTKHSSVLSMVYLGGQNTTALHMEKKLGISGWKEVKTGNVHPQFQKLLTELNKPTGSYDLTVANKLYRENRFTLLSSFLPSHLKKFYLACVESVDFVNATEESQKKINAWVEKQTHGKTSRMSTYQLI
uniref:Serpin domain-containing protein n=1 Tax=Loxodonta africana TaxID=9785 RepID=G3U5T0_LOXAF